MPLGKPGRTDGKAFSLKLRLKDGATFLDCAQFEVQEKQGDKYVTVQKTTDVCGDLFQITTREGEYDGKSIRSAKVALRDPELGETYFIDFSLGSNLGRNLANSLLNLKALNAVEIGLYSQKSATNGKTYPAVALRQGGADETVKWAYDPKDGVLPAAEEFKARGGKIEKDYTNQEVFLLEKLAEFGKTLGKGSQSAGSPAPAAPAKAASKSAPKKAAPAPTSSDGVDEDVPF